jgi:hypothetical protein
VVCWWWKSGALGIESDGASATALILEGRFLGYSFIVADLMTIFVLVWTIIRLHRGELLLLTLDDRATATKEVHDC